MPPSGRIAESLVRGEHTQPYKTALYSIAGSQKIAVGAVPAKMVSHRAGVERFGQYAELSDDIGKMAGEHAHSLFAETYSSQLHSTLADTEALGTLLDETVLAAGDKNMPKDALVCVGIGRAGVSWPECDCNLFCIVLSLVCDFVSSLSGVKFPD